ncbi:MAG: hypothetical protein ACT4OK_09440 [Gemmobacter sp.]
MTVRTCPSAPAAPGALLLGMLGQDGRVRPLRTAMTVDEGFVATARAAGPPEARMRFASPCLEGGCKQWTGHACGVVARVLAEIAPPPASALPPCLIRATCRWYDERGAAACAVCDQVVTDTTAAA